MVIIDIVAGNYDMLTSSQLIDTRTEETIHVHMCSRCSCCSIASSLATLTLVRTISESTPFEIQSDETVHVDVATISVKYVLYGYCTCRSYSSSSSIYIYPRNSNISKRYRITQILRPNCPYRQRHPMYSQQPRRPFPDSLEQDL
jgi:hypothetical protein